MIIHLIIGIVAYLAMVFYLGREGYRTYKDFKNGNYVYGCPKHSIQHIMITITLVIFATVLTLLFGIYYYLMHDICKYHVFLDATYYTILAFYICVSMIFVEHLASEREGCITQHNPKC